MGRSYCVICSFFCYPGVMEIAGFVMVVLFLMSMLSLWEPHGFFLCTQASSGDTSSVLWPTAATCEHKILLAPIPFSGATLTLPITPSCTLSWFCNLTFNFGGCARGYTELWETKKVCLAPTVGWRICESLRWLTAFWAAERCWWRNYSM